MNYQQNSEHFMSKRFLEQGTEIYLWRLHPIAQKFSLPNNPTPLALIDPNTDPLSCAQDAWRVQRNWRTEQYFRCNPVGSHLPNDERSRGKNIEI